MSWNHPVVSHISHQYRTSILKSLIPHICKLMQELVKTRTTFSAISKLSFPWSMSALTNKNFEIRQDSTVILDNFQQWLSLGVPEATFPSNLYNSHWSRSGRSQMFFPPERRTHLSLKKSWKLSCSIPRALSVHLPILYLSATTPMGWGSPQLENKQKHKELRSLRIRIVSWYWRIKGKAVNGKGILKVDDFRHKKIYRHRNMAPNVFYCILFNNFTNI